MPTVNNLRPIDGGVRIGHVHLKVADLDRALAFYCGVLGFELIQRVGTQAAFISAGGYHLGAIGRVYGGVGIAVEHDEWRHRGDA